MHYSRKIYDEARWTTENSIEEQDKAASTLEIRRVAFEIFSEEATSAVKIREEDSNRI